jgi:hypothetical protein
VITHRGAVTGLIGPRPYHVTHRPPLGLGQLIQGIQQHHRGASSHHCRHPGTGARGQQAPRDQVPGRLVGQVRPGSGGQLVAPQRDGDGYRLCREVPVREAVKRLLAQPVGFGTDQP